MLVALLCYSNYLWLLLMLIGGMTLFLVLYESSDTVTLVPRENLKDREWQSTYTYNSHLEGTSAHYYYIWAYSIKASIMKFRNTSNAFCSPSITIFLYRCTFGLPLSVNKIFTVSLPHTGDWFAPWCSAVQSYRSPPAHWMEWVLYWSPAGRLVIMRSLHTIFLYLFIPLI